MINSNKLLQQLVSARGPVGQEDEVKQLCQTVMTPLCDDVFEDAAGNIIGHVKGEKPNNSPIKVMVHMDEISLIVKRISDEGNLRVDPLGGIHPFLLGQGLVEVMGQEMVIPGVLSLGPLHTTEESKAMNKGLSKKVGGKGEALSWEDLYVITRKSKEELQQLGVHPGSRVVIAKARRQLYEVGDCLTGYFMDNRAAITTALVTLDKLQKEKKKLQSDLFVIATTGEEIGGNGACFAAKELPGDITLAIDVGPVAKEYDTKLSASPIICYRDSWSTYDKKLADQLITLSHTLNQQPQTAVFSNYGSDATIVKQKGLTAKAALIALPTENTHGQEIIHRDAIDYGAELLKAFLTQ